MKPEEVKALRYKLGLSQVMLAKALGVTVSAVQKWEQGQRKPGGAAVTLMLKMKS